MIRIFDKTPDGLLFEVTAKEAEGRRFSQVRINALVLFTPGEEEQRDADEAADADRRRREKDEADAKADRKAEIAGRLGLTTADLEDLLK